MKRIIENLNFTKYYYLGYSRYNLTYLTAACTNILPAHNRGIEINSTSGITEISTTSIYNSGTVNYIPMYKLLATEQFHNTQETFRFQLFIASLRIAPDTETDLQGND